MKNFWYYPTTNKNSDSNNSNSNNNNNNTKNKITNDANGENILHSEITEVVLIHCNIVNNNYQQDSRVLYTFIPDKSLN